MGWFQALCATYDACQAAVGIVPPGSDSEDPLVLLPLGHTTIKTGIEVVLDSTGRFVAASANDQRICAPCTEESEARTSKPVAHPLFDKLEYVAGDAQKFLDNLTVMSDEEKKDLFEKQHEAEKQYKAKEESLLKARRKAEASHESYLKALLEWSNSPGALPKIKAVHGYIAQKTLLSDLQREKILDLTLSTWSEIESDWKKEAAKGIRFRVEEPGDSKSALWLDTSLQQSWLNYYCSTLSEQRLCMATGHVELVATRHPKNLNSQSATAKLISNNDSSGFTYGGKDTEAAGEIGYEASQKAHHALRWLIAKQGYRCGEQAIVAWAIDDLPDVLPWQKDGRTTEDAFVSLYSSSQYASDPIEQASAAVDSEYAWSLRRALNGSSDLNRLSDHSRRIAIMAEDAPTKGRMAVTFYTELAEGEYLERIAAWHEACQWKIQKPADSERKQRMEFVGPPSVDSIVSAAFGKPRRNSDQSYNRIKKATRYTRYTILRCIFGGEKIPQNLVNSAVRRVSASTVVDWQWEIDLSVTCALVRKQIVDSSKKEVFDVKLELDRTDRDYLYGRLLAIADKIESAATYKRGGTEKQRATNALRYMNTFSQRPFRTWTLLFSQLQPYIQQLGGADGYLTQIGQVMSLFQPGDYEKRGALDGKYLLGFFTQRDALRHSVNNERSEDGSLAE
ncbi:MAG: type I-C CRISPR-associated protein Cas8c/Csd1 [Coriobacteriia bacterium]|nr:type I-C CRISPR-associated protein Cas8c/Csd1 [Coriobacteriia bacterium]